MAVQSQSGLAPSKSCVRWLVNCQPAAVHLAIHPLRPPAAPAVEPETEADTIETAIGRGGYGNGLQQTRIQTWVDVYGLIYVQVHKRTPH
eukprot:365977-Chlamydomonas_euryale.AAC.9